MNVSAEKTELSSKLQELSKKILNELDNRIETSRKVYVPDLSSMRLINGKVEFHLGNGKLKEIEKKEMDFTFEFPEFYEEFCQKLLEFEVILNILKETYQLEEKRAGSTIKNFIGHIIFKNHKFSNEDKLKKAINGLIKWLDNPTPPYINIKIFLEGIWVNNEEIQIFEDLKIRRIKSSDFEYNSPDLLINQFSAFPFKNIPVTILKWKYHLDIPYNPVELQTKILKEIRMLIYSFLFFRLGSVFSRKSTIPAKILGRNLGFVAGLGYGECHIDFTKGQIVHKNKFLQIKSQLIYVLSKEDIPNLIRIISIFRKSKIKDIIFSNEKTYIKIGLSRYLNAFLNVESKESQISYGVSCLEALFSANPGELQRKLCQRISKVFNIFGFNPLVINDIIIRAYRVRSNYSHGVIEKINHEELEKLSRGILQCVRISLLFFLQIGNSLKKKKNFIYLNRREFEGVLEKQLIKERKKKFLKIIDNSLINDKNYERLQKFIQKRFEIFL